MGVSDYLERVLAGRYIAGPSLDDAIKRARSLNRQGTRVIINYLGEELRDEKAIIRSVEVYKQIIDRIAKERIKADISIKPTEIGILISTTNAKERYAELVKYAAKKHIFVWMDMEERRFVRPSIALYLSSTNANANTNAKAKTKRQIKRSNTGICIQSYLKTSEGELKMLAKHNAVIRLVKGAYSDSERFAFRDRSGTTRNYYVLMDYLFKHFHRFTIATHDASIIEKSIEMNAHYKREITYAMLDGIKKEYLRSLAERGFKTSVYVTFGRAWIRFAYRRLKEGSNLKLIVRSLFDRTGA